MRARTAWIGTAALVAVGAILAFVVAFGASEARHDPERCGAGLVALGPRCCAPGQDLESGRCSGRPSRCPSNMEIGGDPDQGCSVMPARVHFAGGSLELSVSDWEAQGVAEPKRVFLQPFDLDTSEVTYLRWRNCPSCRRIEIREIGLPVTDVSVDEAERFCTQANGRLPSGEEWLFAAAGELARRFPWGSTGLVCRRAVYGIVDGPCASGGDGPQLAGSRPHREKPQGGVDLRRHVGPLTHRNHLSIRA